MRYLLLIIWTLPFIAHAQQDKNELIRKGNEFYKRAEYPKAVDQYQKALQADPHDALAGFNLANAYYRQEQKVEAAKLLAGMLSDVTGKEIRNRIYYNRGVILSDQKNTAESIEAYKNALRQNPSDKEARENLQKALLELKRKSPPPPKKEKKENKQQQQKQSQSKLDQNETRQRLQLLQQKEKQVQEKIQREKNKGAGGSNNKDW